MKSWKLREIATIFLFVSLPGALQAAECDQFLFEKIDAISLRDFGRLDKSETATGPAGSIRYWTFDEEDNPERVGWKIVGLVIARVGDLGETPIGGLLWSRSPAHLSAGAKKSSDDVSIIFVLDKPAKGCKSAFTLTLKIGGELHTDASPIGTIR